MVIFQRELPAFIHVAVNVKLRFVFKKKSIDQELSESGVIYYGQQTEKKMFKSIPPKKKNNTQPTFVLL